MNYLSLITDNTRASDDFIEATKLCKEFGKRVKDWKCLPHTQEYMTALSNHLNEKGRFSPLLEIRRGKGGGTFVHPLLAIHLAEWLSPDFSVVVKQTFKNYLDADVEMTKNLISRTESLEDIQQIQEKTETQRQYLRSEFALNYEGNILADELKAPWLLGRVKGYNNDCAGVNDGERSLMEDNDKATLLFTQLAQAKRMERMRKSDNPYLKAGEAKNDAYDIAKNAYELMNGISAPKPRDYDKMSPADQKRFA